MKAFTFLPLLISLAACGSERVTATPPPAQQPAAVPGQKNDVGGFAAWPIKGAVACSWTQQDPQVNARVAYRVEMGSDSRHVVVVISEADGGYFFGDVTYPLTTEDEVRAARTVKLVVAESATRSWTFVMDIEHLQVIASLVNDGTSQAWGIGDCVYSEDDGNE